MKILFLDIDGVVNSQDNQESTVSLWKENIGYSKDEYGYLFDERCVRWLEWIVLKTGCRLVISSTWKAMGLDDLKLMWEKRNLPGEIIDITPSYVNEEIMETYGGWWGYDRGLEIEQYIQEHNVDRYCIVDDDNDMLPHQEFVQTDSKIGLDGNTAFLIVSTLNK